MMNTTYLVSSIGTVEINELFSKKIAGTYRNAKCEKPDLLFNTNRFTIERCFEKYGCSCEF